MWYQGGPGSFRRTWHFLVYFWWCPGHTLEFILVFSIIISATIICSSTYSISTILALYLWCISWPRVSWILLSFSMSLHKCYYFPVLGDPFFFFCFTNSAYPNSIIFQMLYNFLFFFIIWRDVPCSLFSLFFLKGSSCVNPSDSEVCVWFYEKCLFLPVQGAGLTLMSCSFIRACDRQHDHPTVMQCCFSSIYMLLSVLKTMSRLSLILKWKNFSMATSGDQSQNNCFEFSQKTANRAMPHCRSTTFYSSVYTAISPPAHSVLRMPQNSM